MLRADGRRFEQWNHTATLIATLANINRDPKKTSAFTMDQFHPFLAKSKAKRSFSEFMGVCKGFLPKEKVVHGWR